MAQKPVNINYSTLEPVVDVDNLQVYQPIRPLNSDLSNPGSTSDLIGKLAQLGQATSGAAVAQVSTRVISGGGGGVGHQGPQGPAGSAGVNGVAGTQGPQGVQGATNNGLTAGSSFDDGTFSAPVTIYLLDGGTF